MLYATILALRLQGVLFSEQHGNPLAPAGTVIKRSTPAPQAVMTKPGHRLSWMAQALIGAGVFFICSLPPIYASGPPWKFTTAEGNASVSFGFLAQPQFESLENSAGTGNANNLFLRRLRLIAGGKVGSKLSFFIDSDSPNLGKRREDGERISEFFVQDAILSYAFRPEFTLDGGMLLIPVSHNSGQSAASLLPIDYGPYSFLASEPTCSKVGRDYGLQARGYIKKHFEYRLGVFRGDTDTDAGFPYRTLARFVWYPLEADTGFFYAGTTHGQKRIIGIGASFDRQAHYTANAVDLFIDLPLRSGDAVTVQTDFIRYDGATTFPCLPKQNAWLLEGSYYLRKPKLAPFVQYASRDYTHPDSSDDSRIQGGLAYWILGHKLNIKAGIGRIFKNGAADRTQFVIQTQLFYY